MTKTGITLTILAFLLQGTKTARLVISNVLKVMKTNQESRTTSVMPIKLCFTALCFSNQSTVIVNVKLIIGFPVQGSKTAKPET